MFALIKKSAPTSTGFMRAVGLSTAKVSDFGAVLKRVEPVSRLVMTLTRDAICLKRGLVI